MFSTRIYERYDMQITLPAAAASRWYALDLYTVHRNYPGINYYGPGPNSFSGARSQYRLEDTGFTGTLDLRVAPRLFFGPSAGYLMVNVGPAGSDRFVSAERRFSPPGILQQSNFFRYGAYLQYDYRDHPGGPRSGGNYRAALSRYEDRKVGAYDFDRAELTLEQYIPFFNHQRVIVLRGEAIASRSRHGQTVPFYLQPTLGGTDSLRGYPSRRFSDDNAIVMNAEYRWEAFSGVEMGLFADAGKVFPQHADWNLRGLRTSAGVGMQFHAYSNVFFRLDAGFSREGFQVGIRFKDSFASSTRPPLMRSLF
jgi:outer membrane protein assembly factor BamA